MLRRRLVAPGFAGAAGGSDRHLYYRQVDLKKPEQLMPTGRAQSSVSSLTRDQWSTRHGVNGFRTALKADGKQAKSAATTPITPGRQPDRPKYDAADAQVAWGRTLAFLKAPG